MCHGQKSRFVGDGRPPTFNRNPYNGYINPYYWVDDHPLLYGNNGSLDPGTHVPLDMFNQTYWRLNPNEASKKSPQTSFLRRKKCFKGFQYQPYQYAQTFSGCTQNFKGYI